MMKKLIAFLTSLVLIVSLLPLKDIGTAYAVNEGIGKINESINSSAPQTSLEPAQEPDFTGYTEISTKQELDAVRNDLSGKYVLTADIVFTEEDFAEGGDFYNDGQGWAPIGTDYSNCFTGTLDGNGHTIKGLKINITSDSYVYAGLFGYVDGGTIKNLGMLDSNIKATSTSSFAYVGGIAGYVNNNTTITNCYSTGDVSATSSSSLYNAYAGGIVGSGGTITNCYNTGSVTATSTTNRAYAGGIVGYLYGTITNCYYLDTSSKGVGNGTDTAVKCTDAEMKLASTFAGFDFDTVWTMAGDIEYDYPELCVFTANMPDFTGYIKISTKQELYAVRNDLSGKYVLTADIVFTEEDFASGGDFYNAGQGWAPIGTSDSNAFTGTFDGNGHTIKGLKINIESSSTVYAGLFGYVKDGTIKNLGMLDSDIKATSSNANYIGGIVGYVNGSDNKITNCYNTGSVTATSVERNTYAGGILGYGSSTITNCYNTGSISSSRYAGGIVGSGNQISNCYNTGSISSSRYAGGIVGSGVTITNCYNTGDVTVTSSSSESYAGGILGYGSSTITNCYNTGSVTATASSAYAYAGGIAGFGVTIINCYNTGDVTSCATFSNTYAGGILGLGGTITNCYNTGNVTSVYAGGIAGYVEKGTITNCYYLDTSSKGVGSGTDTAVKCTEEQLKLQSTFAGFDFYIVWTVDGDSEYLYPELISIVDPNRVFEIATKEQLNSVRNNPAGNYILTADIVFAAEDFAEGGDFYNNGKSWEPIGTSSRNAFIGTFDGNGHTIKGLKVNISSSYTLHAGLFGHIEDATVKNLGMLDLDIQAMLTSSSSEVYAYVGGIAGYVNENSEISNCYNTGSVTTTAESTSNSSLSKVYACVGGIAGYVNENSEISNCYNTGSVTATASTSSSSASRAYAYTGGIAGAGGTITNCYNTGSVTATEEETSSFSFDAYTYTGGIVGLAVNNSAVTNCYNTGNISSNANYIGGIVGYVNGSDNKITNCYNAGNISSNANHIGGIVGYVNGRYTKITNCYNTGNISSNANHIGGIVGYVNGSYYYTTITNCYYLDTSSKGVGYGRDTAVKCTDAEMKLASTFAGFDFDTVWTMEGEESYLYPELIDVQHVSKPLKNGFITENEDTYYYVDDTFVTGYYIINNHIYYFGEDGKMTTDGIHTFSPEGYITGSNIFVTIEGDKYYIVNNTIVTNYYVINNHIYYFGTDGKMTEDGTNDFSADGYIAGNNIFVTIEGDKYYIVNNTIVTNYYIINNHIYYFGTDGKMTEDGENTFSPEGYITGNNIFVTIEGDKYYIVNNTIITNYYIINNHIYYFGTDGKMTEDGENNFSSDGYITGNNIFVTIEGDKYYIVNNTIVTNYYVINNHIYYFGSDGKMTEDGTNDFSSDGYITGNNIFVTIEGDKYYIVNNTIITNYYVINNHIYYFGTDGKMTEDGTNDFSADGYITGNNIFVTVEGDKYYIVNNTVVTNYYIINNHIYYFGTDGKMTEDGTNDFSTDGYITGNNIFVTIEGDKYYIVNNTVVTNYYIINNYIYYFGSDGKMTEDGTNDFSAEGYITGNNVFITIEGDKYYIVNNTVVTNYYVINNHIYYFGTDGKMTEDGENTFSPEGYITGNNIFVTVEGDKYYIVNNTIITNYYVINNHIYYFGTDGKMTEDGENDFSAEGYITGNNIFVTIEGDKYYIVNNTIITNYYIINNHIYYFGSDGKMTEDGTNDFSAEGYITGNNIFITIEGDKYYVVNNTVVTNYYVINNHIYYFGSDGKMTEDGTNDFSAEGYITGNEEFVTAGDDTYYLVDNKVSTPPYVIGDLDGDDAVTDSDAIYLLFYTFMPDDYPVNQDCDYDGDGEVTDADAIYLLFYTFMPDDYPIEK